MEQISRIGMDTSKHHFQLHGVDAAEKPVLRRTLRRRDMITFFERLAQTRVAIAAWLEQHYPAIAKHAKAEGAAIYWGDETGIASQGQIGRSYAPRGQTPVVTRTARRITQSTISAVSNRGLMRFIFYEGALNADRFIAFLRRLAKDARQKVFLIVDNLKVYHTARVKSWVAAHAHEIELFYLPAYASDHNPDEFLNNDLKQKLRQQPQRVTRDELTKNTRAVLRAIQRSPRRIQSYFRPSPVRYAA